uniref:Uncharacterized protein n=1 Tax=Rhizophora mucronata TaxID=61149 RepID=A0A2P2P1R4_RHIMU
MLFFTLAVASYGLIFWCRLCWAGMYC